MLFLDIDDGLLSSVHLKDSFQSDRQKIDVERFVEDNPNKALAYAALKKRILELHDQYSKCPTPALYPHSVIAIDSFTQLSNNCLRFIQSNSGTLNTIGTAKQPAMTQGMWGLAISELENLLNFIKTFPVPVIMVFHAKEDMMASSDKEDRLIEKISIFGKNLPASIVSYFDEVIKVRTRMESGKMTPYLQTVPDAVTTCRSRAGLPDGTKTSIGFRDFLKQLGWETIPK